MASSRVSIRPVENPEREYSYDNESRFRREIASYLVQISSDLSEAQNVSGSTSSLASKRESLVSPPMGMVTIG